MPQETKAMPASLDADGSTAAAHDLQGWIPPLASEAEIRDALEKAFDYRGDVTLTLKDGSTIEGYIFDRSTGSALSQCQVRLFLKAGDQKIAVAYDQIAALAFSGRDTAAGKSFETWVKKYRQKKAAGEKNVGIEPEALD